MLVVCEDKERGLIDVIEAGALLLECLRAFTGIEELCFLPLNPDYYIWTGTVTGIDGLKMRSNGYAGTWLLLQSESQVKKLRMLATIYSMDYPNLVDSDELARRLAKEEAAGQCIRSRHGIVLFTEEGLVYMDGTNPDNDWELKYPIYENDCYYEMLRHRPRLFGDAAPAAEGGCQRRVKPDHQIQHRALQRNSQIGFEKVYRHTVQFLIAERRHGERRQRIVQPTRRGMLISAAS